MVEILIASTNVTQNFECLLVGGRLYLYLLESALQSTIFLYRVAIFIQCGSTDTLDGATSQCRLQNVGSIHASGCRTSTDECMYLVDKHDDVGILLQFFYKHLHALFKLATIFRSCNYARHVERIDTLIK